jgi:hypothetical protein
MTWDGIIDYDRLDLWGPSFESIVEEVSGPAVIDAARKSSPEYIEDARKFFEQQVGVNVLVEGLHKRLSPYRVRVYHGTRLGEDELAAVKRVGLQPLTVADRRSLLVRLFKSHPAWPNVKDRLDDILLRFGVDGVKNGYGQREDGAIHVCLSRAGLMRGCNHYLTHGAEVDQNIATVLFDKESAKELLRPGRSPTIASFTAPFGETAKAASPWGFREDEMPSLLRSLFQVWAFSLSHPSFDVAKERDSVALRFPGPISADRLTLEDIQDSLLEVRPYLD